MILKIDLLKYWLSGENLLANPAKKWKDRQNRRRILLLFTYQDKAYVCGPNGEKPPIYPDLDIKQIERI